MLAPPRSLRAAVFVCALALAGCGGEPPAEHRTPAAGTDSAPESAQYPRGVVKVTEGVYSAVGFGLANSILLTGSGGDVIVDTMESAEAARPVREEFSRISKSPVAAIVYTHNHADHIFGAGVLAAGSKPEVIAHASFRAELERLVTATRPITYRRSMRQFGTYLPEDEQLGCGIGPRLRNDSTTTLSMLLPTKTFDGDRLELTIAGIHMVLLHLPGETPDQIAVWLPDKRVLVSGDNYYHSFPNLYAIRGTMTRDVMQWVASLDAMRALRPEFLVPGHTMPVSGADEIQTRLTDYRDAIQYVHDQTVRGMNEGELPDALAATVKLPDALASKPWLAERYGRVDWSVRGIFDGYLGWFGGDAAELSPMSRRERASKIVELAGGVEKTRDRAIAAFEAGDVRWALELSGHLLALGEEVEVARSVRAKALRALAAKETSANGRNYYLTQALEAEEKVTIGELDPSRVQDDLLAQIPISNFLRAMTVRLDPAKAEGKSLAVGFRFTDVGEDWGMTLRNDVVEVAPHLPPAADMTVTTTTKAWKDVLTKKRNATMAFATGDVSVDRNRLELVRFLFLFR